ncbi:MurR/RpiR family transcriptional regulator [Isachenkonia alkalipeptolytica]|uniref:MurR/RpiR family transcriptional regulator n=1 Tax=Isachenkonia alkalipeptolytica TaxID=2565777 RepID=A0AA44BFC6_9CLOT|nr:SIS domain-containing protein [Isachenkonia alkalipeptolytica]NBG88406.1 MurR/RpiR family transcriptional regulator [Isachenkonia alkalipeptolytica]
MIRIDFSKLNPLEKEIHESLKAAALHRSSITIGDAAELCGCSISKISKFVKKLGFANYKQYMQFLYEKELSPRDTTGELERLHRFLEDFDPALVTAFIEEMEKYPKILFFGHGPSYLAAEYFEYKLRFSTGKYVNALSEEFMAENLLDSDTLLVILTTTGAFRPFKDLYQSAKAQGAKVLILAEEYNQSLLETSDQLIWLSKHAQPRELKPHEKSRTVFYIFIEEVAAALGREKE